MLRRKWLAIGDEGKEAPDCCQTAVPCPDRGFCAPFQYAARTPALQSQRDPPGRERLRFCAAVRKRSAEKDATRPDMPRPSDARRFFVPQATREKTRAAVSEGWVQQFWPSLFSPNSFHNSSLGGPEPLIGRLQQLLRDRQINQGGVNIAV